MTYQRSSTTTEIAILGTDTLVEDTLMRLLEREGYATRIIEAHSTGVVDELLDSVNILLLGPGLNADVRKAFLEAMRSNPKTAHVPVLPLSGALRLALLDELSASSSWQSLFEELVEQIGSVLERAAASARTLLADSERPVAQADAP